MNNLGFRVWDMCNKKMFDEDDISFIFFDDVILMQSTGFKDKNGKEIFDGDIVNCGYLFNGSPFDELDEYEKEKGVVKLSNCDCDCGFSIKFKNDTNLFIDVIKSCEDIEVIGNIYEKK